MVDTKGCNLNKIKDEKHIIDFIKTLVKRIDMEAVDEPFIRYTGKGTDKEGFSVAQLIITSSITAHFVNPSQRIYIDIFSCKEFDNKKVLQHIMKYFEPTDMKATFLYRDI